MQASELGMFTGTEQYHKLSLFGKFLCTDGVKFVADEGKAYWLIDAIASYMRKEEFQVWELKVDL